ncbi:Exosome complex [Hyphodiscus hymeniophilus]|uniref:Exosome complex protein n=1 Tax=Hyphodiscus hymeniophilus TaxID=353542 RepID=A0A9P6VLH3_9HELO|nr:Exosome complex [Hyphodiscus hymeniophilus]
MDTSRVLSLLETLDDEIDDLEEATLPLVKAPLSETASKLPLLDKAKLYVLVTYAIESILFSYLRLHGVKARDHPVFTELNRVKQYFQKLKVAENTMNDGAGKRENLTLDKGAAQRIIAAGLSGNAKWDLERAEQKAKERAKAHIKFTELSETMKQNELSKKRKAEDGVFATEEAKSILDSNSDSESSVEAVLESPEQEAAGAASHKKKKRKSSKNKSLDTSEPVSGVSSPVDESKKKEKRDRKKKKKQRGRAKKAKGSEALP